MSHDTETSSGNGLLSNKTFWLIVGIAIFVIVAFILPTPESLTQILDERGIDKKLVDWGVATGLEDAADKAMTVLGIIPMAVVFFATEAIPIGLTGVLMPILAYFLHLLPKGMIGKTFAGDAPLFLLGVLAMGVAVVDGPSQTPGRMDPRMDQGVLSADLRAMHQHGGYRIIYLRPCHVRFYDACYDGCLFRGHPIQEPER